MYVHGILKVSDRERTWIACIIYKIPKKMLEWLGQVYIKKKSLLYLIYSAKAKIKLR